VGHQEVKGVRETLRLLLAGKAEEAIRFVEGTVSLTAVWPRHRSFAGERFAVLGILDAAEAVEARRIEHARECVSVGGELRRRSRGDARERRRGEAGGFWRRRLPELLDYFSGVSEGEGFESESVDASLGVGGGPISSNACSSTFANPSIALRFISSRETFSPFVNTRTPPIEIPTTAGFFFGSWLGSLSFFVLLDEGVGGVVVACDSIPEADAIDITPVI
jgi:hypothetical protein